MTHDLEAEKTLAITLVLEPASWDYCSDTLRPEMFGSEMARAVFEGVRSLVMTGKPITSVAVQAAMLAAGHSGSVVPAWARGRCAMLSEVPVLAGRVRELWARRTLVTAASEVAGSEGNAADLAGRLAETLDAIQSGSEGKAKPIAKLVFDWLQELKADAASGAASVFYETGFPAFDRATGGLARGELSVFAARPGNGKSSWVIALAANFAAAGIPVGMFWLEDDWRDAVRRFLARRLMAEAWKMRGHPAKALNYITGHERFIERADLPIYVDDSHGLTVVDIAARMRRMHREHGVRVFILDHVGEVRIEKDERWGDRHDLALGRVAKVYRDTAKELGAVPILVSQMNRRVEQRSGGIPQMSDLDGSGQIEQAARVIAFVQIERGDDGVATGKGALHLVKATGGQTGMVDLKWNGGSMTWEEA
jgi:replicative DNA helicase